MGDEQKEIRLPVNLAEIQRHADILNYSIDNFTDSDIEEVNQFIKTFWRLKEEENGITKTDKIQNIAKKITDEKWKKAHETIPNHKKLKAFWYKLFRHITS